jgi:two-component system phosphate regulon sensor histidine kinase PhoR
MSYSETQLIGIFHELAGIGLDISGTRNDALARTCELAQTGVNCKACIFTGVNRRDRKLTHAAWAADADLENFLENNQTESESEDRSKWLNFDLILDPPKDGIFRSGLDRNGQGLINPEIARQYNLRSLQAFPLSAESKILPWRMDPVTVWYLNFYFEQDEVTIRREVMEIFVRKAAFIIKRDLEKMRLNSLTDVMQGVTKQNDVHALYDFLLQESLKLIPAAEAGWVSSLNFETGDFQVYDYKVLNGDKDASFDKTVIPNGKGITGMALKEKRPILVNDVTTAEWKNIYEKRIETTVSELAVPIVVEGVDVRIKKEVQKASKPIGVLNLESSRSSAFSESDKEILWALCRQAAIVHERLESERKFKKLREIARGSFNQSKSSILPKFLKEITDSFGFDYANISLVRTATKTIRTERVEIANSVLTGADERKKEYFKRQRDVLDTRCEHRLDSKDIQADICRTLEIEVLSDWDERFEPSIYKDCEHEKLIRVFIPIVASFDNRVIGTLEAGYEKEFRQHIYEEDVRILKDLMEYAIPALELERFHFLEQVIHEFKSPIVGIRSNASYLQKRAEMLEKYQVQAKFEDILTDCEILLSNVFELEYILRGDFKPGVKEMVFVNRDVILKTLNQLRPYASGQDLDAKKIEYKGFDRPKINVYAEKAKLAQIVFNLVMNAIKYAKQNAPNDFAIRIEAEDEKNAYLIKFKDWGIGVPQALKEKIFEEGFRTQEAKRQDVTGSGLGLSIARKIACENGGDLWLANHYGPTEFHWRLPKDGRTGEK